MTDLDGRELLRRYISATLNGLSSGMFDCVWPRADLGRAREMTFGSPTQFPFYLAQTHPHVEMAACHKGRLRLFMHDKWQACPQGRLLVFMPGAVHSEKAMRRNEAYDFLWIHLSQEVFSLHISAFRPGRGYFVHKPRQAFWPDSHARLCDAAAALGACRDNTPMADLPRCRFQALLMDSLCHVREQLAQPPAGADISYQEQMVRLVRRQIEEHFAEPMGLRDLAATTHYTPCYLNTMFKRHEGKPIHQYILDVRMRQAERLLKTTDKPIKRIAFETGFKDPLYFSRIFTRRHGKSPRVWRGEKESSRNRCLDPGARVRNPDLL